MFLLSTMSFSAEKVLLIGDDDYAPYSFVSDGKFKGIYPDLLRKAAEKLAPAYQVELEPMPWKRGLSSVEKGNVFALFAPYKLKGRNFFNPYSTSMYSETVVLFCNEDVMKTPRKIFPDDFTGVIIGMNAGFDLSDTIQDAAASGKITLDYAKGNEANLKKLATKRIGCYANDRNSILFSLKQLRSSPDIGGAKLVEAAVVSAQDSVIGYSAKSKAKYKDDFVLKMNAAIEELKKSGEIDKIVSAYR